MSDFFLSGLVVKSINVFFPSPRLWIFAKHCNFVVLGPSATTGFC